MHVYRRTHSSRTSGNSSAARPTGAEGLDKGAMALAAAMKGSPLTGTAFGSWLADGTHRDGLYKTTGTYK